jgi:hypothetical protein
MLAMIGALPGKVNKSVLEQSHKVTTYISGAIQ